MYINNGRLNNITVFLFHQRIEGSNVILNLESDVFVMDTNPLLISSEAFTYYLWVKNEELIWPERNGIILTMKEASSE